MNNAGNCAIIASIAAAISLILLLLGKLVDSSFLPWSLGVGIGSAIWFIISFISWIKNKGELR